MATAIKSASATSPQAKSTKTTAAQSPAKGGVFWAIYRFLASLKLAVICLSTLSAVLAYATFYESWYGTKAVQERIYGSFGFALLLLFLGLNILCAATIRYPWKKRQIGFVITHAGLLVVLLASVLTYWFCDEGQVAFVEGQRTSELVQTHIPVIRVRPLDPQTGKPNKEYILDFHPGAFAWPEHRTEVLTQKGDPFKLQVKKFYPASIGKYRHDPVTSAEEGTPMIRLAISVKPPNALRPIDLFADDIQDSEKWFVAPGRFRRKAKQLMPLSVVFQQIDPKTAPTALDDFLNPPSTLQDAARIHYVDLNGKLRVYEWLLDDDQRGNSVILPESDLTVTFGGIIGLPESFQQIIGEQTGEFEFPGARFEVRKGDRPARTHYGWWAPLMPSYVPSENDPKDAQPLVQIGFFHAPHFGGGHTGQLEIVATTDGKLYHRYTNREGVKSLGPIKENSAVQIGGGANQPVSLTFEVKEYLPAGKEIFTLAAMQMPKGKQGEGIPGALVEMTVDGETKEFWIRGRGDFEPEFAVYTADGKKRRVVDFQGQAYEVGYDFERTPLPFSLKLVDFDVRFDRGTPQPRSYTSKVLLTDEEREIDDEPRIITMNEPLTHRGMTFYQASYHEVEDPASRQKTGQFMSILAVRYDPIWPIMYSGCALVVLGTFMQFYMRAGVFSDGGKKERERAERRNRRHNTEAETTPKAADSPPAPSEAQPIDL